MLNNLKLLRKSKGYTQKQLSEMIGVSQQTLQKYENRGHEPDIETLKKLADIFGVSVDYLVDHKALGKDPNYAISENEYFLIEKYRKLDRSSRSGIEHIITQLSERKGRS